MEVLPLDRGKAVRQTGAQHKGFFTVSSTVISDLFFKKSWTGAGGMEKNKADRMARLFNECVER